ncbi:MAG: sialidase family protein, partial [bacterium]
LRFSMREKDGWSEPKTIAQGDNWFVNWADFPSMAVLNDGGLAAHWLAKSGKGKFAYDVNISFSKDGGDTWSDPIIPHLDGTPTEHGFVSLLPWGEDRLFAAWLDGRKFATGDGHGGEGAMKNEMTIRFAAIDQDGNLHEETELDPRICDCCQTSAVLTTDGAIVAYRDRSEKEIRDISIVRFENGKWTEPRTVHNDGWEIAGCPVNGPSLATNGNKVAVAWFTAANGTARVNLSVSDDGGKTFGEPVQVDDGSPIGRVDAIMLEDGTSLVSWMERNEESGDIKIRRVHSDGKLEDSMTVAASSSGRASGFPRMQRNSEEIIFAWTEVGEPSRVQTARMELRDF